VTWPGSTPSARRVRALLCPASLKGVLGAGAAAAALARGAREAGATAEELPVADGGEGTVDALQAALGGERREARVPDPLGRPATAGWLVLQDGRAVVEAAAARRVHVMMEKPLAVSNAHAQRIRRAAEKGNIQVLVNYETTWYPSHGTMWTILKERGAAGDIRKMVALDGHSGPKAIKVQPEFFEWLSDPVKNGAGALFDFGCYGANLMTWMMDNQRPLSVSAITQHFQPEVYPRVDDEATILLEYPKAQGIIQASWNWPFNRKDFEVYGEHGLAVATGGNGLRVALPKEPEHAVTPDPRPPDERDSISHLIAVVRGTRKPNALSSLENNLIATEILEAARESARTRQRVTLTPARR